MLLVVALLAAACSGDDDDAAETTTTTIPAPATLLRVAAAEWPACLNPLTCDDDVARTLVLEHVLPKLHELDAAGRYEISPVLAEEPSIEIDPTTGAQHITFRIDPEARWHDGRPITSTDVRGTWLARLATPGALTAGHELISTIDDTDPLVARVTLTEPWADWPELFGGHDGWLLQADAFGPDPDLSGDFTDELPMGAGAFELVSFGPESLVLLARADHWDPDRRPAIDQVRIERNADVDDGVVPGGIDVILPSDRPAELSDELAVRTSPTTEVVGLFLDRRTPPLGSEPVRQAIDEAIDRRDLLGVVFPPDDDLPDVIGCLGWLPQSSSCDGSDLPEEPPSPDAANALLEADAWLLDAEGQRARPGLPLATPIARDPLLARSGAVADAVRRRLEPLGFTVEQQVVPAAIWGEIGREAGLGVGVFAVELGTAERLAALYDCPSGALNPIGWCEAEVILLVERLLGTIDAEERLAIEEELGDRAAATVSWLPLYQRTRAWLLDPDRVTAPVVAPLGSGPLGALHAFERVDG